MAERDYRLGSGGGQFGTGKHQIRAEGFDGGTAEAFDAEEILGRAEHRLRARGGAVAFAEGDQVLGPPLADQWKCGQRGEVDRVGVELVGDVVVLRPVWR